MSINILASKKLLTGTTDYLFQIYTDSEGLFRWRIMWGEEEVGSCNQGYKSKASIESNIKKQASLLSMLVDNLPTEIE